MNTYLKLGVLLAAGLGLAACNSGNRSNGGKTTFGPGSGPVSSGSTGGTGSTGLGSFTTVAPLNSARAAHTATLLSNGKVLVVGGVTASTGTKGDQKTYATEAELYDETANAWSLVSTVSPTPDAGRLLDTSGQVVTGRAWHTATSLASGGVLIAGGLGFERLQGSVPVVEALKSSYLFDPTTNTFTRQPDMPNPRFMHESIAYSTNQRALIVGGFDRYDQQGQGSLASADIFNSVTSTWSSVGATPGAGATTGLHTWGALVAFGPTSALLVGGVGVDRVPGQSSIVLDGLFIGVVTPGTPGSTGGFPTTTTEVFDSATERFTGQGPTPVRFPPPSGILLPGYVSLSTGDAFFAGGWSFTTTMIDTTEILSLTTGQFTQGPTLLTARSGARLAEIGSGNGDVLITGGVGPTTGPLVTTAEVFVGFNQSILGAVNMATPRYAHTATSLQSGRVLVVGGLDNNDRPITSVERYSR